ncbi:hypothetical protein IU474_24995 [Nocardia otitidiscaviarum]|uniref:hypothetical protein n=1 Tax=Nocardia otitidiscaviarum TaxID=1823 RepID=UPI0018946592|nr:hypothetical protein [Nocardia otitidiscaviarum]MBF6240304.1 hypothetical protein [Nocardia otitidiscaviarum]
MLTGGSCFPWCAGADCRGCLRDGRDVVGGQFDGDGGSSAVVVQADFELGDVEQTVQ